MNAGAAEPSERLNRFLARRGVASRRHADELIAAGRVTVNGRAAAIGERVDGGADRVAVDGRPVRRAAPRLVTFAHHKPVGVVSTLSDPQGRPALAAAAAGHPGLAPIGRLDADSRGLLLLTSDGDLAHRIAHPRYRVAKTYRVALAAAIDDARLDDLRAGVLLEDGPARPLAVRRRGRRGRDLEVVMGEGRRREVRRLLAAVGAEVVDLCRVAVGPVRLGDLPVGTSRAISGVELAALYRAVGLEAPR